MSMIHKILGIVMLACSILLAQADSLAQKKEAGKTAKKVEAKEKKAESKAKATEGKEKQSATKEAKRASSETGGIAKKEAPAKSEDPVVGKTKDGKPVYEGARGGFYYLTESGNKTYVKDFVGAKVVGKTADGLPIYEGPRGGRFYYDASGEKVYVKK